MRVLFLTQYGPRAASSRTRVFHYLPFLRERGVDCDVITVLPDDLLDDAHLVASRHPLRKLRYYARALTRTWTCGARAVRRARDYDLLFVQKVILPAFLRRSLARCATPMVYDFDDAIFTTEIRSGHWLARFKEARNARGLPAMLGLARHAVVENDYTGDVARAHCPVLTITGPIDTTPYRDVPPPAPAEQEAGGLRLAWIGSGSTVAYLDRLAPLLQRLAGRIPGLRLLVVGAEWSAPGVQVECRPWDLAREAADLTSCDVGIMPVPDDPWTRGKGGYKLLQYMAAGLPVVTDPVGINSEIVIDGETGFLAADEAGWEQALLRLAEEADLRRRMGVAGRERVEERYSLVSQQERLLAMLHDVARAA